MGRLYRRLTSYRCIRRTLETLFLTSFLFGIACLYHNLPPSYPKDLDGFEAFGAPKVTAVFRDFDQNLLDEVKESVSYLHGEIPDLDIIILAETSGIFHSKYLRFPGYDPIRVLRIYGNGTSDFNLGVLAGSDYMIFLPYRARISRSTFAIILDKYWEASANSKDIGIVAVPLAGVPFKLSLCYQVSLYRNRNGGSPYQDIEYNSEAGSVSDSVGVYRPPESVTTTPRPFPKSAATSVSDDCQHPMASKKQAGSSGGTGACCNCQLLSSLSKWSHHILVLRTRDLVQLPRPWVSPSDVSLSVQMRMFQRKSVQFCPGLAISAGGAARNAQMEIPYHAMGGGIHVPPPDKSTAAAAQQPPLNIHHRQTTNLSPHQAASRRNLAKGNGDSGRPAEMEAKNIIMNMDDKWTTIKTTQTSKPNNAVIRKTQMFIREDRKLSRVFGVFDVRFLIS